MQGCRSGGCGGCCEWVGRGQVDSGRNATSVERVLCTQGVVARADLVHLVENEHVSDLYIFEPRHGDEVALGDEVGASGYRGNCVVAGLRPEQ